MKLNFTSFFPRSSTTLENTIFIAHFSHNFSLLCNERKKSYYNYLILKQKHAYIQQFQAVFFLNYKFSKKNYVMSFLPSEYEKQKNLPMFYYNFLRRFWKSSYVIILKVSYFQKYGHIFVNFFECWETSDWLLSWFESTNLKNPNFKIVYQKGKDIILTSFLKIPCL